MRGEFLGVWPATWRQVWLKLQAHEDVGDDLFCELLPAFNKALRAPLSNAQLLTLRNDQVLCRRTFRRISVAEIRGEPVLASFLEQAYELIDDLWGNASAEYYFTLLSSFIDTYSLRYELRRPCTLCPTLPGLFASLLRDLRAATLRDPHLDQLMKDFDASVRDLRQDCSDSRIKTCIQKQMNLLEALGSCCPGVTQETLGKICDELSSWPHLKIREAMKNLYHFASDYPGIRHAGKPKNAIRGIEMRDMVAVSILLAGFTPYLTELDARAIYGAADA